MAETDQIILNQIIHKGGKVLVSLSSLDESLRISEEALYRHRLVEGTVLTPAQVEQLITEAKHWQCRQEAMRLLALRQHATRELLFKLGRKDFDRELVGEVVAEMTRQGLLDDAQHAYNLGMALLRRRPCGRPYLVAHLQKKYIDRSIAEDAAEACLSGTEESDLAGDALRQRSREYEKFELEVARRKAYNYLARRGFSYGAVKTAIDELIDRETR
ncbi:MAG: recombination regulator RecX [candidate division Zixibacteria bacterium]|nr:recombination regulator RecX [candidate division Zixibacteria bacterium]